MKHGQPRHPKKPRSIQRYYSACLQANLKSALSALEHDHSKEARALKRKAHRRFIEGKTDGIHSPDPLVKAVIVAYRNYYREALMHPKSAKTAEKTLFRNLQEIVRQAGIPRGRQLSHAELEKTLAGFLEARGYFTFFGRTAPLRSLFIWRHQSRRNYSVRLPEKQQVVTVILMERFVEQGWLHYATFGKCHVTGWADRNVLHFVRTALSLAGSRFHIAYLIHEAQHLADYREFPKLHQRDLEYRAKLAEVLSAPKPRIYLGKFHAEAVDDRAIPHGFAAFRVLRNIDQRVAPRASAREIRKAAADLLRQHSARLHILGSQTVRTAFMRKYNK